MKPRRRPPRHRVRLAQRLVVGFCASLIAGTLAAPAAATLSEDVAHLTTVWSSQSARVERLRPRLLTRGDRIPVPLPHWHASDTSGGCTNIAIIASPSVTFTVYAVKGGEAEPRSSQVGWLQLVDCGAYRAEFARTSIEMRSPRGVVEVIVASSASPLPSLGRSLAHRDPGPASAAGQAGVAPIPPPIEGRAVAWEAQARRDGALAIGRQLLRAKEGEVPTARLELGEGCHRVSALGLQAALGDAPRDLDLFLRSESLPALALQDQSENSDAEIAVCLGVPTPIRLGVLGLGSSEPVVLQYAEFPLPEGLPEHWGPALRARFGDAFFRRGFRGPAREPIYESLGVAGRTVLPLHLELQTCYVAAVGSIQGDVKALLVDVAPSDREGAADGTSDEAAVVVGFCTADDGFARLRIEAAGSSVAWLAAIWRIGRRLLGEGSP